VQPPDEEAIKPDKLAGQRRVEMQLRGRLARRFVRRAVTGDQRQALGARV
jgi:hypothetical protein